MQSIKADGGSVSTCNSGDSLQRSAGKDFQSLIVIASTRKECLAAHAGVAMNLCVSGLVYFLYITWCGPGLS